MIGESSPAGEAVYYHGGVIGRHPGDLIYSARDLGRDYTAHYRALKGLASRLLYKPEFVYMTTHLGAARGYAAKYMNLGGFHRPGDVYVVEPQSEVLLDPEYDNPNLTGTFGMTASPVVVKEVVERRVALSPREQNREAWPTWCFTTGKPAYSSDGTVEISEEMRGKGVTEQYVALLPKWMDFSTEFGNGGRICKPGSPGVPATADEVLDVLSHLRLDTSEHLIVGALDRSLVGNFVCSYCGRQFGHARAKLKKADVLAATVHQAGDELAVIARFNGGLDWFLPALLRRTPDRWKWMRVPT